ncbi:MAG: cation-efflux pump, partial [Gammaproteobacteria bacterium]|nr:cation-efflux pump [Gammaproteobacteria bacterium]
WQDIEFGSEIEKVVLHYLDGRVSVDVFLPLGNLPPEKTDELSAAIRKAAMQAQDVGDVRVYFQA